MRCIRTEIMMWGQFPSLAMTFRRSMVSELPTMSSSVFGLYFSTLSVRQRNPTASLPHVPWKLVW